MLKKIMLFAAATLLIASLVGCSCTATPTPTPTPTLVPTAAATPMTPDTTDPGTMTDPNAAMTPGAETTPGSNGGTGGATGTGATIENFQEGTTVQETDAPEVKTAIEAKYPDATIQSIKHATNEGKQVYAVELKTGGASKTVYVTPDGTVTEKGA